jgi:malic enzyme
MEGKGLLFKIFSDIDVFDIEIGTKTLKSSYKLSYYCANLGGYKPRGHQGTRII